MCVSRKQRARRGRRGAASSRLHADRQVGGRRSAVVHRERIEVMRKGWQIGARLTPAEFLGADRPTLEPAATMRAVAEIEATSWKRGDGSRRWRTPPQERAERRPRNGLIEQTPARAVTRPSTEPGAVEPGLGGVDGSETHRRRVQERARRDPGPERLGVARHRGRGPLVAAGLRRGAAGHPRVTWIPAAPGGADRRSSRVWCPGRDDPRRPVFGTQRPLLSVRGRGLELVDNSRR